MSAVVTCLKRMRLPLLAATLAMACILLLDIFVFDPTARAGREAPEQEAEVPEAEADAKEAKQDSKTLLFSQQNWNNIKDDDDWDAVFDIAAWSSLLNEGFVGANVKDEPPLKRVRKPPGQTAPVPQDGAMKAKAAAEKAAAQKVVISLGLGGNPSDVVSGKSKKKLKKAKKGTGGPPEEFEKLPTMDANKVYEWFDTSYKKSATYGKANAFVEDEPLFKSCATSIVAARAWGKTFLTLGPFRYLAKSKNPCWNPDNGGKFTCVPYFFLAGVSGPATDDVMQKILIHPDVIGRSEQQYWWDVGRHADVPWDTYREKYQTEIDTIMQEINQYKSSSKIYGDATNTYFSSPSGWERLSGNENCDEPRITLASHLRRLRVKGLVIVVMPHPTRRLLAEYRQLVKGKVNANQFHDLVIQGIDTYKTCFAKYSMRQCAYNYTLADTVKLSIHEGFYSLYMEDWIRIFPPEQFLVFRFEDYVKNLVPTLEAIYDFLDVPQIEPTELAIAADPTTKEFRDLVKAHNPTGFLPETVALLNDFYQPFLRRLGEIMGNPTKFTWSDYVTLTSDRHDDDFVV